MGQNNQGNQLIGWKYKTELVSETLNSFFASYSSPGLITRPKITVNGSSITVSPFSALVEPSNNETVFSASDTEYGNRVSGKLVKVTTTQSFTINLLNYNLGTHTEGNGGWVALVLTYEHTGTEDNYAEILPASSGCTYPSGGISYDVNYLTGTGSGQKRGIVIATIMRGRLTGASSDIYAVTTQGADISDLLLTSEGFDPRMWISVQSPRRIPANGRAYLELRTHNGNYAGYIHFANGIVPVSGSSSTVNIESAYLGKWFTGNLSYTLNDIHVVNLTFMQNQPAIVLYNTDESSYINHPDIQGVLETNASRWVYYPLNRIRIYPLKPHVPAWYVQDATLKLY